MKRFPAIRKQRIVSFFLWALSSGVVSASGLLGLGASSEVGDVQEGNVGPSSAPSVIWVASFATSLADVQTDPGGPLKRLQDRRETTSDDGQSETLRGALRESVGGILGEIRGSSESLVGDDAATVAVKSAEILQRDLVESLNKMGIPAKAWTSRTSWPESGVIIDGQFLTIDEGNQLRRMVVGLGAGESYLETQVQLYELDGSSAVPFLAFHTDGDSGMAPGLLVGGAVGKAVTGAAAVGAGVSGYRASKKGTVSDLGNTASSISKYLKGYWQQRGWLPSDGE